MLDKPSNTGSGEVALAESLLLQIKRFCGAYDEWLFGVS